MRTDVFGGVLGFCDVVLLYIVLIVISFKFVCSVEVTQATIIRFRRNGFCESHQRRTC